MTLIKNSKININQLTLKSVSSVDVVAQKGHLYVVKYLVKNGAEIRSLMGLFRMI